MGRQEEKSAQSREKLMLAARELFREKGIDNVGVREIAKQAGATTGTFYYHFLSKGDIIRAIYEENDLKFQEIFNKLEKKQPYAESILEFFSVYLASKVMEDGIDQTMHRMFLLKVKVSPRNSYLYHGIESLIEKAKSAGEIDLKYETAEIVHQLFLIHRGIVYDWCVTDEAMRPELSELERKVMGRMLSTFLIENK